MLSINTNNNVNTEIPNEMPSDKPVELKKISALDRLDHLIHELDNLDDIPGDRLEQLICKISSLFHHIQRKINKEISVSYEKARDSHLQEVVGHLRGRTAVAFSLASSGCHLFAGLGGLAPQSIFAGAERINGASHALTQGRFQPFVEFTTRFNTNNPEDVQHIAKVINEMFSGCGRATDGVQGIFNDRRHSYQTEHQTGIEKYRQMKDVETQDATTAGNQADAARQNANDRENKRHETFMNMGRG